MLPILTSHQLPPAPALKNKNPQFHHQQYTQHLILGYEPGIENTPPYPPSKAREKARTGRWKSVPPIPSS